MNKNISEKELLILETATKLFSEKGFNATTTNEIAKKAEIAEGTIFKYFKTKKDILDTIIVRSINLLSEKIAVKSLEEFIENNENLSEKELLKEVIKQRISVVNEHFPIIKIVFSEVLINKEIREKWIKKIILAAFPLVQEIIEKGIKKGSFKNINSITATRSLASMIVFYFLHKNLINDYLPIREEQKELDDILEIFLNGIDEGE